MEPFTTRDQPIGNPMADTHEIQVAEAAGRVAGGIMDSTGELEDLHGEKMVLNMGPSHPATHGVLRIILELDGEIITKATPDVGYLR